MMDILEKELKTKLHTPYQVDGVRWMLNRENDDTVCFKDECIVKGGILADEVGLGKTIMTISVLIANPCNKTLILLPKSLVSQWESQIKKFTNLKNIFTIDSKSKHISDDGIYLMSNSILNSKSQNVGSSIAHTIVWDRIIIDEAHLLRNNKSKIYNSCIALQSNIKWALTATPVMNRMTDFVHIMHWFGLSQYICQIEKEKISKKFILRRTKEDVSIFNKKLKLPDCHINVNYIPFETKKEVDIYLDVFTKERKKVMNSKNKTVTDLLEHLLRIRQLSIHPQLYLDGMTKKTKCNQGKWESSVTKVNSLLSNLKSQPFGEKTLIFCQFIKEMDIYQSILKENGFEVVRLDGSMNMEDRNLAVNQFKHIPKITIFLIQIATGGQGINLQIANHIHIMSPSWNPAIEYQAIGRAHRTGQQKNVYVTKYVISSGDDKIPFVEENMIALQQKKKKIISEIMNDNRILDDGTCFKSTGNSELSSCEIYNLFNIKSIYNN